MQAKGNERMLLRCSRGNVGSSFNVIRVHCLQSSWQLFEDKNLNLVEPGWSSVRISEGQPPQQSNRMRHPSINANTPQNIPLCKL